ncbi:MAG TPA: hypothetical protein HPP77_03930 [Candidatus Hydrogenedentes bacterium]|nr:hypothetical protein [Candidatus Hydrogenedentota bacterium]HIJ73070.1 hypothetical protein [Candidatus Hydrogenedentota bacterium]
MERPTWATVVGIVGIILGCFGIIGAGQLAMMPKMMELQKEMFSAMEKTMAQEAARSGGPMPPVAPFKAFQKMWDFPEWFGTWCVVAGFLALFVSGFYVFASIRLIQVKPSAIKLFYTAAGIAIGFTLLRGVVAMAAESFMGLGMLMGGMFGLVINVVLLIVVATADKEAFSSQQAQQDS